jgi:transketolase
MRNDFVKQMLVEMKRDPSIYFLTADLGFKALEPLEAAFPERFLNVGISEQHMIGMAAGLALEGKKVVAYSIASFATMRPFEQIRDDLCYDDLDVRVIGAGGGYNYASHGVTHHTVEDLAIMRALPGMKVLAPAYSWEAREATRAIMQTRGPYYMRLGKSPGFAFERPSFRFKIGTGFVIREGRDVVLASTGNVLDVAVQTADLLQAKTRNSVAVISMPSVKPLDRALIQGYAKAAKGFFTIEEHSTTGGLGSVVGEVLWEADFPRARFRSFGLPPEQFIKAVGNRDHMLKLAGLDSDTLARTIIDGLRSA